MSLSKLQSQILRLLAAQRDPESYVAGSTPLNRDGFRTSDDIDIFHDREERVARAAEMDSEILQAKGLEVLGSGASPRFTLPRCAVATSAPRLEWVVDSDFRFFPIVKDALFGYVLHPIDLATNKVMAAAGRQRPADLFDLIAIHEQILPLGAVIWAAVEGPQVLHRKA